MSVEAEEISHLQSDPATLEGVQHVELGDELSALVLLDGFMRKKPFASGTCANIGSLVTPTSCMERFVHRSSGKYARQFVSAIVAHRSIN